jgi:hypothetical protein
MGGPGSGGRRAGRQGVAYGNRSDLNKLPIRTATGQTYGQAGAQQAAQRAVPMAPPSATPLAPPSSSAVPLNAPTARPNEPVTAGLSSGPGPGPEALMQTQMDTTRAQLAALYRLYPNNDLLGLLEDVDRGVTF